MATSFKDIKSREEGIQSYNRPLLRKLAEEIAIEWKDLVDLTPKEVTELQDILFALNPNINRMKELLKKFPLVKTHPYKLPHILPLEPPFHVPYGFSFLLTRLRKNKLKDLREILIKEYLTPEKVDELVREFFRKGPDYFIIFDLPEDLNQGPVEKIIKERVVKILDGRDPEWQINPTQTKK